MNRENAGRTWLNAEYEVLKERFAQGMTPDEIADAHGRSVGAVLGKLVQLGLLATGAHDYHKVSADPWILYKQIRVE